LLWRADYGRRSISGSSSTADDRTIPLTEQRSFVVACPTLELSWYTIDVSSTLVASEHYENCAAPLGVPRVFRNRFLCFGGETLIQQLFEEFIEENTDGVF
jgi:hypothetical protein